MHEQPSSPEEVKLPEKTAEQLYVELNQAFDKTRELMNQVHELEMLTFVEDLSEEKRNAIIAERDQLAALRDETWETEKRLEEQWKKISDHEFAKAEKKFNE